MSIEGQGHFFTIYFPGFVCFVLYLAKISGERLQDHWSSGLFQSDKNSDAMATYSSHRLIIGKVEICIFLAHLSQRLIDELIVYPCSGVRPSYFVVRPQFQTSSSPKPLARSKPNFMWSLLE